MSNWWNFLIKSRRNLISGPIAIFEHPHFNMQRPKELNWITTILFRQAQEVVFYRRRNLNKGTSINDVPRFLAFFWPTYLPTPDFVLFWKRYLFNDVLFWSTYLLSTASVHLKHRRVEINLPIDVLKAFVSSCLKVYNTDSLMISPIKAELLQEGMIFLIHLLFLLFIDVLVMKK